MANQTDPSAGALELPGLEAVGALPEAPLLRRTSASPTSRSAFDDTLWELEPATRAKHKLYAAYLDAWFPILLQASHVDRVTCVDAFAGPGRYLGGEEGSPVFAIRRLLNHDRVDAMRLSRDRVTLLFIEARRDRYDHLVGTLTKEFGPLDDLPIRVVVKHGRAEVDLMPLLSEVGAWGAPILSIYDSWGNVSVPWDDVCRIARNPMSEIVVTFGPNWFSRFEGPKAKQLDAVFGGRDHWEPSDPSAMVSDRWEAWLTTYKRAVIRAGFQYPIAFEARARTGIPLYLVFGTNHPSGVEAFKRAKFTVDTERGMAFNDPRSSAARRAAELATQPTLFDGEIDDPSKPDDELLGFVLLKLREKPSTVDEVAGFLQLDTPQWMSTHARSAARYLIKQGMIVTDAPTKRLLGSTILTINE